VYERPVNVFVAGFIGSPAMNLVRGRLSHRAGWRLAFNGAELPLGELDSETAGFLTRYVDAEVTVGLRPEDLRVGGPARLLSQPTFAARLELIEPVGNEIFVSTRFGEVDLTLRLPPQPLPSPGTLVDLTFTPERLHFFDSRTGERI
jgi:multiple sugar transport system ATP-binding protein